MRVDCVVDPNDDNIRIPFSLLDGHTLYEILVRLPVKSLLQVKRVCRQWRSVVRDPYFVDLHYNRSKKSCPKLLSFVNREFLFSVGLFEGGVLLDQMKVELSSEGRFDLVDILNPVNGLVCFKKSRDKVLIFNPSTGDKTSWIESMVWKEYGNKKRPFYGFGFDSETKEHKVVCLWHLNNPQYKTSASDVCEVLTVGKNTWRKIDDVPPYKAYGESVHVNGVVYWLSTYNYHDLGRSAKAKFIIAFDIGREKFGVISIPKFIADCRETSFWMSNNSQDLLVIDGCVGLLDRRVMVDEDNKNVIKIWIFHGDHQEKSVTVSVSNWTEETILIPVEGVQNGKIPWSELVFQAITGTNLIIMTTEQDKQPKGVFSLYCYDRENKTLNFVEINTLINGKGLLNRNVYRIYCGTFVESLYPVQQEKEGEDEMKKMLDIFNTIENKIVFWFLDCHYNGSFLCQIYAMEFCWR